ncbi:hypothetical protein CAFE_31330 [Caprobacter fermentans]|uniref:Permease n=1 Tax=Caproicibacter fermentans TaxID=2576756 RepID=A0A6N8I3T0_9FIRM|nr:permease [Caproicibacter fermentans]MVB12397.1 hypothetical protein [Caproicibacter fermentans]
MKHYRHFKAAIYCRAGDLAAVAEQRDFPERFDWLTRHVSIGKVYLETYRSGFLLPMGEMKRWITFFQERGIETAGGITTDAENKGDGGFHPLCYTSRATKELLIRVVQETASWFDEIILDDFYFTNCKCPDCIKAKRDRSWSEFRTALMLDFSKNVLIPAAKKVNPNVKMVIKFPNWYDHFADCGYDLVGEPQVFDGVYTGTETRSPAWTQQHLPKYLSYFHLRRMERLVPGRNGGGWFDPYESTGNLTEYADQGYLTLYAGAKEVTLFCLGTLLEASYSLSASVAGQVFEETDALLDGLGEPIGAACYFSAGSRGEDYLPDFIGMLGIPLEPEVEYPEAAKTVFLTAGAAADSSVLAKVQKSLMDGADVIVTSGFLQASGAKFQQELANVFLTGKKVLVRRYCLSTDGGLSFGLSAEGAQTVLIPQLEFQTNDMWSLANGMDGDSNFPILLKTSYGRGNLYFLAVPDNMEGLYHFPTRVLNAVRAVFCKNLPARLEGPAKVALFLYGNNRLIVRSFALCSEEVTVVLKGGTVLEEITTGKLLHSSLENGENAVHFQALPGVSRHFRIIMDRE